MRQRFYVNGKLERSIKGEAETLRRYIDNAQREWSKNLMPLTAPGEFDFNNGHSVERLSQDESTVDRDWETFK